MHNTRTRFTSTELSKMSHASHEVEAEATKGITVSNKEASIACGRS